MSDLYDANGHPIWPCCEHCEPEADGECWASVIGHGCSCLKCPPTTNNATTTATPATAHDERTSK